RGQAHAINKGFAKTSGEILTWLNSDDQLVPGALAAMAMAFHTSGADMVAGVCELYRDGEFQNAHLTSCVDGPLPLDDLLDLDGCWNTGKFFYQPEVMFTRELWERCGGRVDESWFYSMDYELWLRFAEHGARLHVIGRSIVHFRVHDEQKTSATEGFMTELPKVQKAFLERTGRAWMPRSLPKPGLSSLRIVFLNDLGCLGGASIAHQRLAKAVSLAGHQVFPVAISKYVDPTSPLATDDVVVNAVAQYQPDLVVVGNLHGAGMLAGVVGEITARWPAVFVMHDLWIVSGRCAYPGDCTKYRTGCDDACPTPYEYPPLAPHRIRDAWELRRKILTAERAPILACNSEWTAQAARSAVASASNDRPTVVPIHLAFPLDTFRPLDKSQCREVLDLPQDRFIVLFSASSLDEVRKGAAHLAEAIATLDLDDVLPVCLGHGSATGSAVKNMRCMGYISDENELAMLYSAADVFVGPSLEEAFGQVFIEAAACGTPSVGFPVGGIPEAVNHGVSGLVAEVASSEALAKAIRRLHDDPGLCQDLGRWARIWVENEWSEKSSYRTLFNALDAAGLRQRLGLAPKIGFAAVPPLVGEIARLDSRYPRWRTLAARTGRMGWWAVRTSWWVLQRMTTRQGRARLHGLASRVLRPFRTRGRKQRVV
ncbi:MAG: glycosyltransferase, partial [Planctomycetota bacterium]